MRFRMKTSRLNRWGQASSVEIAVLVAFATAGFLAVAHVLKNAVMGSIGQNAQSIGPQLDLTGGYKSISNAQVDEKTADSGKSVTTTVISCSKMSHGLGGDSATDVGCTPEADGKTIFDAQ